MRSAAVLIVALLAGCQPTSSRAVIELYMHPNGLSNCVMTDGDKWVADASCCPDGFSAAGFSTPSATAYEREVIKGEGEDGEKEYKETRRLYRHVICLENAKVP